MQILKADSGRTLILSGALRIHVADELRAVLLDFVHTAPTPVVDLSGVTECDATALQLLIAAGRTAESVSKPFLLNELPAAVRDAGGALGLSVAALANRGTEDAI